jgi:hypothetical protein
VVLKVVFVQNFGHLLVLDILQQLKKKKEKKKLLPKDEVEVQREAPVINDSIFRSIILHNILIKN